MPKPITIATTRFRSIAAARERCRKILSGGRPGTEVIGDDAEFLKALLDARPDKIAEIGARQIVRFWRDVQPGPFTQTRCFYAELDDGSRVDFSFEKALANITEAQHPT